MSNARSHIFLSYAHDDQGDVRKLRDDLIAAGEAVWWDQDIEPGMDWDFEIQSAMRRSYAVIVCLSERVAQRRESGIYREISDAIAAYRNYPPGRIFLILVKLSECEIPLVRIDETRNLRSLQYVNLFPDQTDWGRGVARIVRALKKAPHHP